MSLNPLDWFDGVRYEKKLRQIKEEHFQRVADLEDKIHKQNMSYRELEVKHKHDLTELEQKYKLEVQEIVARHEKELKTATHKLELEKEKWDVELQKRETKHEKELNKKKLDTEREVFSRLTQVIEREGKAERTVVAAQADILNMLKEAIPNVNWDRQDGSPKLAIEHTGTPEQTINIKSDKSKRTRKRNRG
jgi:phenylalanyl-tRNA synthetase alpha subunit